MWRKSEQNSFASAFDIKITGEKIETNLLNNDDFRSVGNQRTGSNKGENEMLILIYFVAVGVIIGVMIETFFKNQRGELGSVLSAVVGGIGGFAGGMLLGMFGTTIFGAGFGDLAPMFGAPIFALVLNLLVRFFKK